MVDPKFNSIQFISFIKDSLSAANITVTLHISTYYVVS